MTWRRLAASVRWPSWARRLRHPAMVLVVSLLLTGAMAQYARVTSYEKDRLRFESLVQKLEATINGRIETTIALLESGAGLFEAADSIAREDFRRFIRRIDLQRRYPGIQGIGLIRWVKPEPRPARRAGEPAAMDGGPAWSRPEYQRVMYLEPLERSARPLLASDSVTEPTRGVAMDRAWETGHPSASWRVTLVAGPEATPTAGFILYVPIYHRGTRLDLRESRRAALEGFVFSPVRVDELLGDVLRPWTREVAVQISLGTDAAPPEPLHRFDVAAGLRGPPPPARFTATRSLDVGGVPWQLWFGTRPGFDAGSERGHTAVVLLIGGMISGVLFMVSRAERGARLGAERIAAELKASEDALRESEERTRLTLDRALDAVITMDGRGRITGWSAQAEQLFGWSEAEAVTQELSELIIPPTHRAAHERGLAHYRATGEGPVLNRRVELTALRRDGTEFPVELAIAPVRLKGTTIFSAFVRDISERKRGEAALATYMDRLEILHEIDQALIAADAPTAIAEAALRRLRPLLGVPRAVIAVFDLAAGEGEWLAVETHGPTTMGPGARFPLAMMGDLDALRRGETQAIEDLGALAHVPQAQALLAEGIRAYLVVPLVAGGTLIGSLNLGIDRPGQIREEQVSIAREVATQLAIALEQARLHQRIKRQAEELEQRVTERTQQLRAEIGDRRRAEETAARANQAKSDFLSRMSHELRTPLNGILGFAQLLEMEGLAVEQHDSVEQILKAGRHLLGLINEVLDISRIEAGRLQLSLEPVPVAETLREAMSLVRPIAVARGISLRSDLPDSAQHVLADRQRLQQVLLNLLSNGVKYTGAHGTVTVTCDEDPGARLRIRVSDTGRGIPPDKLERLFTPFERLGAETTAVEGTGLGLTLSKHLVEAMGGTLSVETQMGVGSIFSVELPIAVAPAEAIVDATTAAPGPLAVAVPFVVLYVEDNLSNLQLVERVLARRPGVTLLPALQGRRGLDLARQHRPDLILLDRHLPDMPGDEVLQLLLEDPRTAGIPVMILSADASPGQIRRLLEAGAHSYLTKPLDVPKLLGLLDDMIARTASAAAASPSGARRSEDSGP